MLTKENIRTLIKRMNKEYKTTIFLTSHDVGDIEKLCKRVIIVNDGKIVLDESILNYNKKKKLMNIKDNISKHDNLFTNLDKAFKNLCLEMKQVSNRMTEISNLFIGVGIGKKTFNHFSLLSLLICREGITEKYFLHLLQNT